MMSLNFAHVLPTKLLFRKRYVTLFFILIATFLWAGSSFANLLPVLPKVHMDLKAKLVDNVAHGLLDQTKHVGLGQSLTKETSGGDASSSSNIKREPSSMDAEHHLEYYKKQNTTFIAFSPVSYQRGDNFNRVYYNKSSPSEYFTKWNQSKIEQCGGQFVAYAKEIAVLHDVIIDNSKASGRIGGENFRSLMNQQEQEEFFQYKPGFMQLQCDAKPTYSFFQNNHLNDWMRSIEVTQRTFMSDYNLYKDDAVYLAITRYEYVNLYHTMTDFYNAFLVTTFLSLTQKQTHILIMDGHPWGSLDPVWNTLFPSVERLGHLPKRTKFKNLIFGMQGYNSPIFVGLSNIPGGHLPLADEFRDFVLNSYNLPIHRRLNCSNVNMLLIWRRNYIAHPRNPSGDVHRKIKNEEELIDAIRLAYRNDTVRGAQTDRLDMWDQLRLTSEADIMIGMHGAALSLLMFLPKHGGLIELMPNYIHPEWKKHFISMAQWKNLIYRRWINKENKLEFPNHYTEVPPKTVINIIHEIKSEMCYNTKTELV